MKRKGFTLVELLIVIAILGVLTAMMSISAGRSTASAKAARIISNIEVCKTAASVYYSENYDIDLSSKKASEFLTATYIPNFSNFTDSATTIEAGSGTGYGSWDIKVDFSNEADSAGIQDALSKAKGYSAVVAGTTSFTVTLSDGKVSVTTTKKDEGE